MTVIFIFIDISIICYYFDELKIYYKVPCICVHNKLYKKKDLANKDSSLRSEWRYVGGMRGYKMGWRSHPILYPLRTKILSFRLKGGICQIKINYFIRIHLFINYLLKNITFCAICYTHLKKALKPHLFSFVTFD